ncbi:MAG: tyrosine-type recombinase/integrase, partial [Bacteroidaceae bacterium]|nr:tyrosine-type recombinase/integrase [Bacteroidaceae bacterium]
AEFNEEIELAFTAFAKQNSVPRPKELKEYVNTSLGRDQKTADAPPPPASLKELFDRFIRECGRERNWDSRVIGKFDVVYRHLVSAVPGITPYNITKESMFALRDWYVTKTYTNRYTKKQFVTLKCFLRWINTLGGHKIPKDVLDFKTNLKVIDKTIAHLTYEELRMFTDFEFSSEHLGRARDLWCFMAYTSLRYSDLKRLNRAHINGNCICMLAEKTDGKLTIPLTEGAKKIMSRYSDGSNGEIFAVPANHLLNWSIRDAAKEAGLNRIIIDTYYVGDKKYETPKKFYDIISCHDARRTFVSCSLAMGIPPEVVMKCTGHTGYNTMKPYIETSSDTVSLEMDKWNRSQNRL